MQFVETLSSKIKMAAPSEAKLVFAAVTNIPSEFHSVDLRNYFSQFIEGSGFDCFHFRHRPELRRKRVENIASTSSSKLKLTEVSHSDNQQTDLDPRLGTKRVHVKKHEVHRPQHADKSKTTCCVVRLTNQNMIKLLKMYHRKPWIDKNGDVMSARCVISRIRVSNDTEGTLSLVDIHIKKGVKQGV